MISAVHCRTHKVNGTSVNTDIFLVCVLFVNCSSYKRTVRTHHKSAKFCAKFYITHSGRNKNFVKYLVNTLADNSNVVWLLVRSVRDTNTT